MHAAAETSHQGQPRRASYATYEPQGRIAVEGGENGAGEIRTRTASLLAGAGGVGGGLKPG